jgi:hypothetical protein
MSRHVRDDMPCRSNFGQMGPCRRHKIEDFVAVCVGLSRHLPDFRNSNVEIYYGMGVHTHRYYRTSTLISAMFSILSCSPHETNNYHNTPQHNRKHNHAPCPTAPSAHASYKGYGCKNAKPPRPPHRNTMIDVVVLGCGPIGTGEGAAAPFIGVHILGEIRPAGGFVTLAESRWEDQIGPSIPVQKLNHTTINRRGPLNVR